MAHQRRCISVALILEKAKCFATMDNEKIAGKERKKVKFFLRCFAIFKKTWNLRAFFWHGESGVL